VDCSLHKLYLAETHFVVGSVILSSAGCNGSPSRVRDDEWAGFIAIRHHTNKKEETV
jgi:hypothetical protein